MSLEPLAELTSDPQYDCLIISDLHLGSDVCQAKLLEEFLEWAPLHSRELVINGDIFDDLNFKRLKKAHFACLRSIRRNSDHEDFRLIWMRGNHDGPADIVSHVVGVDVYDEYIFENGEVRLLILHGDQFDTFITHYVWLSEIACGIFYLIQKIAPHRACEVDSPCFEKVAAQQSARRAKGDRIRQNAWMQVCHLRPHASADGFRKRRRALLQQRHVDGGAAVSLRVGKRQRSATGILALGRPRDPGTACRTG